ncbi:MAG: hypothetical protein DMF61_14050 [Blastocatellia bacterium AA13]|nr:MAG: hypothetical protein DMF61_14050 [Blastocatellia bacterium AA13]
MCPYPPINRRAINHNIPLGCFREVSAEEFIRRFLQHVLPKRFIKVRFYGLLSPGNRHLLNKARKLLGAGHYVKPSSRGGFTPR